MITNGLRPIRFDHRDYDFHRTFGTIGDLGTVLDVDAGLTMPDQESYNSIFNFPALPFGCTGYTQSELCQDQDQTLYDPSFTYTKTLLVENAQPGVGCDIRDSLNSTIVFGVRGKGEDDTAALTHHRGQYFVVLQAPDYFDGIRSAINTNFAMRRSVSIGSPWFPEWHNISADGIMPMPYLPTVSFLAGIFSALGLNTIFGSYYNTLPWHNYKCSGYTTTNTKGQLIRGGEIFLKIKSWQGTAFGDAGWCYMSRLITNEVLAVPATGAFTLGKADPTNIKNVQLNIQAVIDNLMLRLPKPLTPMNEDKMYNAAKNALGTHKTLDESVPPEVGCAEAWSAVALTAGVHGIPPGGFAGTAQVREFLHTNAQFELITVPEPGATIVSPTGSGNGTVRGHVGVMAKFGTQYINDWGICSNDSNSGLFREQWCLTEWNKYYGIAGKLPVEMYRFKG